MTSALPQNRRTREHPESPQPPAPDRRGRPAAHADREQADQTLVASEVGRKGRQEPGRVMDPTPVRQPELLPLGQNPGDWICAKMNCCKGIRQSSNYFYREFCYQCGSSRPVFTEGARQRPSSETLDPRSAPGPSITAQPQVPAATPPPEPPRPVVTVPVWSPVLPYPLAPDDDSSPSQEHQRSAGYPGTAAVVPLIGNNADRHRHGSHHRAPDLDHQGVQQQQYRTMEARHGRRHRRATVRLPTRIPPRRQPIVIVAAVITKYL